MILSSQYRTDCGLPTADYGLGIKHGRSLKIALLTHKSQKSTNF